VAVSSEGALFEYGSDAEIAGVLGALRDRVAVVVASAKRDGAAARQLDHYASARTIFRDQDEMRRIAARTGYELVDARRGLFSDQVALRPL
jgi:hypothetical protein